MWSAWRLRHALSFDTGTTSALSTSPCISLRINDHNVAGGMKVDLTLIPMRGPVRDSLRRCTRHGRTQCSIDRSTPRTMRSHLSVRTSKPASHAPRSRASLCGRNHATNVSQQACCIKAGSRNAMLSSDGRTLAWEEATPRPRRSVGNMAPRPVEHSNLVHGINYLRIFGS